jgi:hypothetical protein
LEVAWKLWYFDEHHIPSQFRDMFLKGSADTSSVVKCIESMQNIYKKLIEKFCVGKIFLEMQQAWLLHINFYKIICLIMGVVFIILLLVLLEFLIM